MRPIFRKLAAAVKKVWAGGELGTRLPTMETVETWAAGGLAVPDCFESETPWAELAARVDARTLTLDEVAAGAAPDVLKRLMLAALHEPASQAKLIKNPELLDRLARRIEAGPLAAVVAEPAKTAPAAAEESPAPRRVEDLSIEELRAALMEQQQ